MEKNTYTQNENKNNPKTMCLYVPSGEYRDLISCVVLCTCICFCVLQINEFNYDQHDSSNISYENCYILFKIKLIVCNVSAEL